jgi:hypothetical protein
VRIEEAEEVCQPKWVVVYLCEGCASNCPAQAPPAGPVASPASPATNVLTSLFGGLKR